MKIKLFIDEDVHNELGAALRKIGFDAITAYEALRKGCTDLEQLEYAISQQRAVMTFNVEEWVKMIAKYFELGLTHYGIVVSKQLTFSPTFHRLVNLMNLLTQEDMINRLEYLSNWQ